MEHDTNPQPHTEYQEINDLAVRPSDADLPTEKTEELVTDSPVELTASGTEVPKDWMKTIGIVFGGQVFSFLSSIASGFALIWFLTLTGSAMILVLGTVSYLLPLALLSPLAGSLVDRYNRKIIMILADYYIAVMTVVMVILVILGLVSVPLVLVMIFLRSIGQAFRLTAMNAMIPLIVPDKHLVRVSSVTSGLGAASNIYGPALGIALYEAVGLQLALSIDIMGALIAGSVLFLVRIPDIRLAKEAQTKMIREMKDGLAAIKEKVGMPPFFILVALACVFFFPMAALFPLMTTQHFGGDGYAAALIELSWGACFLTGTVALGVWGGGKRLTQLIRYALGACALVIITCGLLPADGYWWFFVLTGLMAFTGVMFEVPMMAVIQKNIEPEKLGRVLSVFNSLLAAASLVGLGLAGAVGDITGVALIFVASGAGMFLVFVATFFLPSIQKLDKLEEPDE